MYFEVCSIQGVPHVMNVNNKLKTITDTRTRCHFALSEKSWGDFKANHLLYMAQIWHPRKPPNFSKKLLVDRVLFEKMYFNFCFHINTPLIYLPCIANGHYFSL